MAPQNTHPEDNQHQEVNGEYDEDAALEAAIALSLQQETVEDTNSGLHMSKVAADATKAQPTKASGTDSWLLERKKMEDERLQRLRKRTAGEAALDEPSVRHRVVPANSVPVNLVSEATVSRQAQTKPQASAPAPAQALRFPRGAVKRTWVYGCPRADDDIKIEEILEKDKLELAVVSSFQWDESWFLTKVDIARTKLVFIAYANNSAEQNMLRANVPSNRIRLCFPPMNGMGCMHSKLQLLKYSSHLRIVVPSGNLVPYDWGETGVLENMVFLIDLPRLDMTHDNDRSSQNTNAVETFFGSELRRFLRAQGLDESLIKSLDNFDFTETERYGFVHTIAGSHTDQLCQQTGYRGLQCTVQSLGLATNDPISVDYVTSSLGSLDHQFLKRIYSSCQGILNDQDMEQGKAKIQHRATAVGMTGGDKELGDKFRIYFPTEDTVAKSRGGRAAGGTICFQEQWWDSSKFPRETLRDSASTRAGVLMHDKVIFVQHDGGGVPGDPGTAWAYIGSANLSESAWGRLGKERGSGKAKLTCRNWECGVLVPTRKTSRSSASTHSDAGEAGRNLEVFRGVVPVPMSVPANAYGISSIGTAANRPWLFMKRDLQHP